MAAAEPLDNWYRRARKARWQNLADVKIDYPHADLVGTCTVFNIGGNKYRLVVKIVYRAQAIFIKHVLTHKDYDKGVWKHDC
jgi:mRNA interferase HigB